MYDYVCYVQVDASWPIQRLTRSCQLCLEPGISPNSRSFSEYGWASTCSNPGNPWQPMLPVALSGTVTALSSLSESVTSIASATKSTTCPCTAAQHQMTREAFAFVSVFKGNALTETNLLKSLYPTDRSKNPRPTKINSPTERTNW